MPHVGKNHLICVSRPIPMAANVKILFRPFLLKLYLQCALKNVKHLKIL